MDQTKRVPQPVNLGKVASGAQTLDTTTEMERVSHGLADTALRLTYIADSLQSRIHKFMQVPESADSTAPEATAPEHGTMVAIMHHQRRVTAECERLDALSAALRQIL